MDNRGRQRNLTYDGDRLSLIVAFVTVADCLSFAEAGRLLMQTPSTVSRKVLRLEEILGARLFNRTTRSVALTEVGKLYHQECSMVLDYLSQADAKVTSSNDEPRGLLRVSVPVAFGHLHMSTAFVDYLQKYSKVSLEVCYSDKFVDLITEDFDASIRIGNLPDSSLIARFLGPNHRILVASPAYIQRFGEPHHPNDLANHDCIRYNLYKSSGNIWHFKKDKIEEAVSVVGRFRCDNSQAVSDAAEQGLGIGIVARYICDDKLRAGRLVEVLSDWKTTPESNIYFCYPSTRFLSPKVSSLATYIVERFRDAEWAKRRS
ncbi:LysR family transcriptional regulator [Caballeronia sp. GACF5]|uniref:LysR family transcriptional regulator n=1 Tax=Caballeronia sp. GACF5 TaxID=2921746 RepID=UPI0020290C35|nr:LysR family transcriptional regulator [Caballeronia sp. GACF5]